jgi:hypothetical protein
MMINVSCDALGYSGVPNPGREELDGILDAISAESKDSGLDQRFILAVMVSSPKVLLLSTGGPDVLLLPKFDANSWDDLDARIQGLCAGKVHVVSGRFDQESWADASKYSTPSVSSGVSTPERVLTCRADTQRNRKLQRRRRHGRSLSRHGNQTDDPRWLLRHRSRRRSEASVSFPTSPNRNKAYLPEFFEC